MYINYNFVKNVKVTKAEVVMMLGFFYAAFYVAIAIKWGDIRGWSKYYSTILFFIIGDLLYHWLLFDLYPMWKFVPYGPDVKLGVTHTLIALSIMLIKYPSIVLVYLNKFPEKLKWYIPYIVLWTALLSLNEFITLKAGGLEYYNGWTFLWSVFFGFAMFVILRIHYIRPLLGIGIAFIFIIFLWFIFDVPTDVVFR